MLPVEPQFIGQLPEGLRIQSVEVVPDMVQVFMPESGLKKGSPVQVVRTTPIYLHGMQTETTVYCKIVTPAGIQPDRRWPDIEVRIRVGAQKKNPPLK